jgi:hypothetical protein
VYKICEESVERCGELSAAGQESINTSFLIQGILGIFYNTLFPELHDRIFARTQDVQQQSAGIFVLVSDLHEMINRISTFLTGKLLNAPKLSPDDREFCQSCRKRFNIELETRIIDSLNSFVMAILGDCEAIMET